MRFLIAIYNDPEWFPPTLNAITVLSNHLTDITVVGVRSKNCEWNYPKNTRLNYINSIGKIKRIIHFIKAIKSELKQGKDWIICYDDSALLLFYFSTFFNKPKTKIWYHNHDVIEPEKVRFLSLNWLVLKLHKRIFKHIDIFTLPSEARKIYFPINSLKGNYYLLPNYAEKLFVETYTNTIKNESNNKDKLKLIYQGVLDNTHGFEQIITILNRRINGKKLELLLVGPISKKYKNELLKLADRINVSAQLKIIGSVAYNELPKYTKNCDIGLAMHIPKNIQYSTGATASNKIYEYISFGLPVLLADNEHYNTVLSAYQWASFTKIDGESIYKALINIDNNYFIYSKAAYNDFKSKFNYEVAINTILKKEALI